MTQFSTILLIMLGIYFAFMLLLFNFKKIERLFSLTSTKQLQTKESWEKLNRIWVDGGADLTVYDFSSGTEFHLRLSFKEKDGSSASKSFDGKDVNAVIREGYAWAVERGYIKE